MFPQDAIISIPTKHRALVWIMSCGYLIPQSTIFHSYRGDQFYCCKLEYLENKPPIHRKLLINIIT